MFASRITFFAHGFLFAISAVTFSNGSGDFPGGGMQQAARENGQASIHNQENQNPVSEEKMHFGNFSVSLSVKDLKVSKAFYEKLDFQEVGGQLEHNYLIMQNGTTTIGLFQGMFEGNLLTFNPGWNHKKETLEKFQDVRELQATLKERGIVPVTEADAATGGPASFVFVDPDGNTILVDQHVAKPKQEKTACPPFPGSANPTASKTTTRYENHHEIPDLCIRNVADRIINLSGPGTCRACNQQGTACRIRVAETV